MTNTGDWSPPPITCLICKGGAREDWGRRNTHGDWVCWGCEFGITAGLDPLAVDTHQRAYLAGNKWARLEKTERKLAEREREVAHCSHEWECLGQEPSKFYKLRCSVCETVVFSTGAPSRWTSRAQNHFCRCGDKATVHLTEIVKMQKTETHLCHICAQTYGASGSNFSVKEYLRGLE